VRREARGVKEERRSWGRSGLTFFSTYQEKMEKHYAKCKSAQELLDKLPTRGVSAPIKVPKNDPETPKTFVILNETVFCRFIDYDKRLLLDSINWQNLLDKVEPAGGMDVESMLLLSSLPSPHPSILPSLPHSFLYPCSFLYFHLLSSLL
jgi:hypothetical protein